MENPQFDVDSLKKVVKKLDDYLWNITNNVVCTICHELFTSPVTTSCSHSFCLKCLQRLLCRMTSTKNSCPLCRTCVKKREINHNHILTKISNICFDLPTAFKEDVMSLNSNLKDLSNELVDSSRIVGLSIDGDKDNKTAKKLSKTKKTINMKSNDSSSEINLSCEEKNQKNEEVTDLKSVSQFELKTQLYVADSPEIERKLRKVKRIPSKQKVNDWLENVNKDADPSCSYSNDNLVSRDESVIQGTENRCSSGSMIRINYDKSKKLNGTVDNSQKIVDGDPYEFIASQRTYGMKTRKRVGRGRKKTVPEFELIQNFTKEGVRRSRFSKNSVLLNDVCDDNLQKIRRTYSRRSDKAIKTDDKTGETDRKIMSDSENSDELGVKSESEIVPQVKRAVALGPDADSDNSIDTSVKKAKIDTNALVTEDINSSSKSETSGQINVKNTAQVSGKCAKSPGWSRVSNLKMDFEKSEKRSRRTLNISGGGLNSNSSKKSVTEASPESASGIILNNDVYIEDLSQNSSLLVGFEKPCSAEKEEDFKLAVDNMQKELEAEMEVMGCGKTKDAEEPVTAQKEVTHKTPKHRTIPFALLGRIKKKKKSSIVFVKLGRLSSCFKKSRSTVVKLIFPRTFSRNSKKTTFATIGTQTDELRLMNPKQNDDEMKSEGFKQVNKISIEVQTSESFLRSDTKEVQTSQSVEGNSTTTQTVKPSSLLFNSPGEKNQTTHNEVMDLDSEMQFQLNRTWITEEESASKKAAKSNFPCEAETVDLVSNDSDVLMQRAIDNMNMDLARVRSASHSPIRQPQQCEESDSDIFIEQTPPKNISINSKEATTLVKTNDEFLSNTKQTAEESFLMLSEGQNKLLSDSLDHKEKFPLSFSNRTENNENNQNEPNLIRGENELERKICIVSSGVINQKNIEKFVNKFKVDYLNCPKKNMTHLIVGLHENEDEELVPYCTPKVLYAIANKKWVVTEAWVEKCLNSNSIVAEELFESVDPAGGNGCNVARLSKHFLLENCEVYLLGAYGSVTKEEFSGLIVDCGGKVVRQPSEFSYSPKVIRMILADGSDLKEDSQIQALTRKYRSLVMSRDAVIVSIQSYKMVNFTPFIIHSVPYEEMLKWGYPPDLVQNDGRDESDSD